MKETELKNGTIDCIWNGYTATPSRRKRIAFSRVYELSGQSLVVRKDSGINKMADMKGGNARGPGDLDGPDRPQQVSTGAEGHHQEQEADPLPGQFRCLCGPSGGPDTGDFRGRSTPATTPPTSHTTTITSRSPPPNTLLTGLLLGYGRGDTTLVKKVNYALGVLRKDGTLRRINKKWLGINSNYLGPTSEFAKSNRQR